MPKTHDATKYFKGDGVTLLVPLGLPPEDPLLLQKIKFDWGVLKYKILALGKSWAVKMEEYVLITSYSVLEGT